MDKTNDSVIAKNRLARISPRKLRLVANSIRGKNAMEALELLPFIDKKGGKLVYKVLKSAISNAKTNKGLKPNELVVSEIRIDGVGTIKRARIASKSGVNRILKRNSSISIKLSVKA